MSHPWPGSMINPTTSYPIVAPCGGVGVVGLFAGLGGIVTGIGVEFLAQSLEETIPKGETKTPVRYKVIANSLRTASVLGGTGLATVAGLGLLGVSATAAVSIASFGVGLAIVGVAGLCFVAYRYWKQKTKRIDFSFIRINY